MTFIPLAVDTKGHLYDEFIRLLFLHTHREVSVMVNEFPEESDQFRFLRSSCFTDLKVGVGLIMVKVSVIRISRKNWRDLPAILPFVFDCRWLEPWPI